VIATTIDHGSTLAKVGFTYSGTQPKASSKEWLHLPSEGHRSDWQCIQPSTVAALTAVSLAL